MKTFSTSLPAIALTLFLFLVAGCRPMDDANSDQGVAGVQPAALESEKIVDVQPRIRGNVEPAVVAEDAESSVYPPPACHPWAER